MNEAANNPKNRSESGLSDKDQRLEETRDIRPDEVKSSVSSSVTDTSSHDERQLVFGKRPRIGDEQRAQLRIRLRAAAIVLLLGFVLFLIRNLFVESEAIINWAQIGVTVILGWIVFGLSQLERVSERALRLTEMVVFFLPAAFFVLFCVAGMLRAMRLEDTLVAMSVSKTTVISFFSLIMVYGTFIPSTWKRTFCIASVLALTTPITMIVFRTLVPQFRDTIADAATFVEVSNNTIMLFLGASCAVLASHTFHRLRAEAFQARRMGQYRLHRLIGKGGMGEVYLGEHSFLKRPCAIKVLRSDRSIDAKTLARFEREVKLTARLTHPNTVQVFDYGHDESGTFFYVMEYLPGLSLQELVDQFGPLPVERVVYLVRQILGALHEAEQQSLIHRDIKPSNILVTERGGRFDVAKLVDFGLARPMEPVEDIHQTQFGGVTGSPLYLSPEQAVGSEPDSRSDLYSLGAVAYFALTGRPPFEGENAMAVIVAHARDDAPNLHDICPDVPPSLASVVHRCLQKKPEDRYQTTRDLLDDLDQLSIDNIWDQHIAKTWWVEQVGDIHLAGIEQSSSLAQDSTEATRQLLDETVEYAPR